MPLIDNDGLKQAIRDHLRRTEQAETSFSLSLGNRKLVGDILRRNRKVGLSLAARIMTAIEADDSGRESGVTLTKD